jgi:hypothetical protein
MDLSFHWKFIYLFNFCSGNNSGQYFGMNFSKDEFVIPPLEYDNICYPLDQYLSIEPTPNLQLQG